jgi:hypothetical protein
MYDHVIKGVLEAAYPDVLWIDFTSSDSLRHLDEAIISHLLKETARQECRPVIVCSFDSLSTMGTRQDTSILEVEGLHHLRLPASLDMIEDILQKARGALGAAEQILGHPSFRRYSVRKIRSYKHRCDNVWMSMQGSASWSERMLGGEPGVKPSMLAEVRPHRLQELAGEYESLAPLVALTGIEGLDWVPRYLSEAIQLATAVCEEPSPAKAVQLARQSAGRIQDVAQILAGVKEFKNRD